MEPSRCRDELPNRERQQERERKQKQQPQKQSSLTSRSSSSSRLPSFSLGHFLTLNNLFNVLLVSVAVLEFYQQAGSLFAEAGKKSKKYVVVKEVGTSWKKVPVYKKVPVKVLKVVFKKKKSEKPWKKWFKKQMIVKIPQEHHKHHEHHHHHAASEGHQTWALPAFIATPSSISDIFEAWPTDYSAQQQQQQPHQQQAQSLVGMSPSSPAPVSLPTSVNDLKSVGSEEYPAFLAAAAAQLVHSQFAAPVAADHQAQHQQQQPQQIASPGLHFDPMQSLASSLANASAAPDAQLAALQQHHQAVQLMQQQQVGSPQKSDHHHHHHQQYHKSEQRRKR